MIKAVIFDMDGLIIESESIQSKAYEEILNGYGKKPILNTQGIVHTVGIREKENWEILKKKYAVKEKTEVLMQKRSRVYLNLLKQNLHPQKGFISLLNLLKNHKVKLAVASSSVMEHIETVLSTLKVKDYFDVIVSGQFVARGKPFPDINLEAAKKLGIKPEYCLVLDDAQSGVESAKNANMKVIAVPNKFTKEHDFSKADLILNSLEEVNWKIISSL